MSATNNRDQRVETKAVAEWRGRPIDAGVARKLYASLAGRTRTRALDATPTPARLRSTKPTDFALIV